MRGGWTRGVHEEECTLELGRTHFRNWNEAGARWQYPCARCQADDAREAVLRVIQVCDRYEHIDSAGEAGNQPAEVGTRLQLVQQHVAGGQHRDRIRLGRFPAAIARLLPDSARDFLVRMATKP